MIIDIKAFLLYKQYDCCGVESYHIGIEFLRICFRLNPHIPLKASFLGLTHISVFKQLT